jgi:hypothetical protein
VGLRVGQGDTTMDVTRPAAMPEPRWERLGAELGARGYQPHLVTPGGAAPLPAVRNPPAAMPSEKVTAQAGWFWWPWLPQIRA